MLAYRAGTTKRSGGGGGSAAPRPASASMGPTVSSFSSPTTYGGSNAGIVGSHGGISYGGGGGGGVSYGGASYQGGGGAATPDFSALTSMFNGAGAGGSSAPPISFTPEAISISAQDNPQIQALLGDYGKFRGEMAAGSDLEATQALQRQRDLISGMSNEYAGEAAARGILGSGAAQQDMLKKIVEPGQQQMAQTNASLAADARNKQLQALGAQSGLATQQANLTQAQQRFGLDTWQAKTGAQVQAAQLQALQRNQALGNNLEMARFMMSLYS